MYMYWQWQIYQTWGLAASGSRSRNLKRSYPACPKNKKKFAPSYFDYNINIIDIKTLISNGRPTCFCSVSFSSLFFFFTNKYCARDFLERLN